MAENHVSGKRKHEQKEEAVPCTGQFGPATATPLLL